jgi:hypothetical protein
VDFVLASELVPGTYVVLTTRSPLGFLVRLFCRSPWDHAVLVTGPDEIVQATVKGIKKGRLSQFRGCRACANSTEPMTAGQREVAVTRARGFLGEEYAFPAVVVIGLRKLGLRWPWLLRVSDDKDALFCSELVSECGQAAGKDWSCGQSSPALVTPAMLAQRKPFTHPVIWD